MSKRKGFSCKTCRRYHAHPAYVYAHWRVVLVHTCACGAKHEMLYGEVKQVKPGVKP